jgi:hypothetical protein
MAVKHWGNNTGDPGYRGDEDWESNPAYKNILKVNDVNNGNDAKIAIHAINSSTNFDAKALQVDGKTQLSGDVMIDSGDVVIETYALITNGLDVQGNSTFTNELQIGGGVAITGNSELSGDLKVCGATELDGNITAKGTLVVTDHKMVLIEDVNESNDDKVALTVSNSSTNSEARAISAYGTSEITALDTGVSHGLIVKNESANEDALALEVTGQTSMNTTDAGDPRTWALHIVGKTTHAEFGALKVEGRTDMHGVADQNLMSTTLCLKNASQMDGSCALEVDDAPSHFNRRVHVQINRGAGEIDSGHPGEEHADPTDLKIGTCLNHTNDLYLSREGQLTEVQGRLQIDERLNVGPADDVGQIDANNAHDLQLGTQNATDDVVIGRSTKNVEIAAAVLDAEGEFRIGPNNGAGKIDSGGSAGTPEDLKVGTQTVTSNVQLGRSGKIVDVMCNERLNSNQMIVNGVASLTTSGGAGFVFNSSGHGNGASIDFYIGGVMLRFVDATGWH